MSTLSSLLRWEMRIRSSEYTGFVQQDLFKLHLLHMVKYCYMCSLKNRVVRLSVYPVLSSEASRPFDPFVALRFYTSLVEREEKNLVDKG